MPPTTLSPNPARSSALPRPTSRRAWYGLVFLCVGLLYVGASFGPAVFDQNEAQYAGAAREMLDLPGDYLPAMRGQLERGQWFVPTNNGIPRLQKPPLVYWALMLSMRVFGVNEFGARLPNALAALLWFGATALLGRRLGGPTLGAVAALILSTMAGVFIFSHLIAPEPYLAAFLTLTFWCFASACQEPARAASWMRLAWVFMALGCFSKGLHGAIYPWCVAGFLAWRHPRTRPVWRELLRPVGPLIFAVILAPWYVTIERKYPGFLRDQFINEQLGHVINQRFPPDSARVPLLIFALQHLVLFLPWTFFIPAAWQAHAATPVTTSSNHASHFGRDLLAAWLGVTVISILFSSLQDYYLMTAWGPVAFWLARPWIQSRRELPSAPTAWTLKGPGWAFALLGVAALGVAFWFQAHTQMGAGDPDKLSAGRDNALGVITGFSAATWRRLMPLFWGTGGVFLVGGVISARFARRGHFQATLPTTALMMVGVLLFAARGLCLLEDYFSLKHAVQAINQEAGSEALVVCHGLPTDNPSLLFYLNREVHWVGASPAGEFASRELKIGAGLFLSEEEFTRTWASRREVYLIVEQSALPYWQTRLGSTLAQAQLIARTGTRLVLVNHTVIKVSER